MIVKKFSKENIDDVYKIQQAAYKPLFEKYQDAETNPYMETKEQLLMKYTREGTQGYIFIEDDITVGAVRIIVRDEFSKVSALAVLPEYQDRGIAQSALKQIEKIHDDCKCWILDTLLQEKGNCHLYEKLGYLRVGKPRKINDRLTLVDYKKRKDNAEIWDAYDKNGNKLGFDLYRDEPVPKGVHHIVVEIYVFSNDGKVLITQRDKNKSYPLKWENTGGSILKGETPIQGAIRELKEETGIAVSEEQLHLAYTEVGEPSIYKCFVARVTGKEKVILQEGETVDYKWLPYNEFLEFIKTDKYVDRISASILRHIVEIELCLGKTHYMKLNRTPFDKIKRGEKTIEIRCNDEKRQMLKENDIIVFGLVDDEKETITTRVKALYRFKSFYELYSAFDFSEFGCKEYTMQRMLNETETIYSKEKEQEYGALGIRIEVMQGQEKR